MRIEVHGKIGFAIRRAIEYNLAGLLGEVTELVPVPDFKSGGSWLWSGKVSSILMLSRQKWKNPHGADP